MNFNRLHLVLLAAVMLPGLAMAQTTTRATFPVAKFFKDGNTASVTVHLDCNTGLPLEQSQTIDAGDSVTFVVESFDDGEMDCEVTEGTYEGYTPEYSCMAYSECEPDANGCTFTGIANGDINACEIVNFPDAQEVTVWKDWVIDGDGGDLLDPNYKIKLTCDNEILGGDPCRQDPGVTSGGDDYGYCQGGTWSWTFWNHSGTNDAAYTADVIPDWDGGTTCWVSEKIYDSSVESSEECTFNVDIAEEGEGCTITNTVFYEGIPTLSQYGLAIMALLMLGVGFVGFRRFV